jgi:hypothetical protein
MAVLVYMTHALGWWSLVASIFGSRVGAIQPQTSSSSSSARNPSTTRRDTLGWFLATTVAVGGGVTPTPAWAASALQDSLDVDSFLRTGVDPGGNMGVSSQTGKSKPETGVYFR